MLTIGVFDGVHRGHQVIISRAVERARQVHQPALLLTFDPHPAEVVRPGSHPAVLTGARRKAELVAELGVDALCVVPFTQEFSRLSPAQFVHDILVEQLHASTVVVGENFRFGAKAAGDIRELTRLGENFGFATEGIGLIAEAGTRFSSTAIRALVSAGDVTAAGLALGRPHRVSGVVVRGDGRGREIGYPTANVQPSPQTGIPADGVYAGRLIRVDGTMLAAAVSVGTNPTFAGTERRVEAFVLDFAGDLYGENVGIDFVARLRGQVRYASLEPLLDQMALDVDETRRLLA